MSARVTLYTAPLCGYCNAAKRLLTSKGVAFETIDLGGDPAARMALVERTGWRTVPVILVDDALIGGYTELSVAFRRGELAHLMESSGA
jgi:glutaredoxin 3